MKFGRIINGEAIDVSDVDPLTLFHPDIAKDFAELPDEVENGWRLEVGRWREPPRAVPAPPTDEPSAPEPAFRLKLTPSEFRNAFSAFEEVAILEYSEARPDGEDPAATTLRKVVGVFFDRVRDRHLTEVDLGDERNLGGLDLLVSVGILTPARRAAIAQGLPA